MRAEETKLRRAWAGYRQDMLGHYLVSGREELAWVVELNDAIRVRAVELGVTMRVTLKPDRYADVQRVTEVIADRVPEDTYGYPHSHSRRTYSLIAEDPRPAA